MPDTNLPTNLNLPPGVPQPAGAAAAAPRMATRASSKAPEAPPDPKPAAQPAASASKGKRPANTSATSQSAGKPRAQPAAAPSAGSSQNAGPPIPNTDAARPPAPMGPPASAGPAQGAGSNAQPLTETVAALRAHIRVLEARMAAQRPAQPAPEQPPTAPVAQAQPPPPPPATRLPTTSLVAEPAVVEQARAAMAAHMASENAPAGQLPDIVPGYHADILSIAAPPRVSRAVKLGHYVPYSLLTPAARASVTPSDNDSVIVALTGDRNLDRSGERNISVADWMAAAEAIVGLVRTHHGDARAQAFERHHRTVTRIAAQADWQAAFLYDIQEREMAAADPKHDLGTMNQVRFTMALTDHFQRSVLAQPMHRATQPEPSRRPYTEETRARNPKRARTNTPGAAAPGRCFRCGSNGHFPASCTAGTTSTGRPAAALSTTSRSPNALMGPHGKAYCFSFALQSSCRDRNACTQYHACSICGSTAHGAGVCTAA